jgi:hypothetical protein
MKIILEVPDDIIEIVPEHGIPLKVTCDEKLIEVLLSLPAFMKLIGVIGDYTSVHYYHFLLERVRNIWEQRKRGR